MLGHTIRTRIFHDNLNPMLRRAWPLLLAMLVGSAGVCQTALPERVVPFTLTDEVGLPANRAQLMAAARLAWRFTFGQQPGAHVDGMNDTLGTIQGSARLPYRSTLLQAREESQGSVSYRITIMVDNGHCSVRLYDLRHTGNREAQGGGVDVGTIYTGEAPEKHLPGLNLSVSRRLHADVRTACSAKLEELLRAFASALRANVGP